MRTSHFCILYWSHNSYNYLKLLTFFNKFISLQVSFSRSSVIKVLNLHCPANSDHLFGWVAFVLLLNDVQKKSIRLRYYGKEINISATFIGINFIFILLS